MTPLSKGFLRRVGRLLGQPYHGLFKRTPGGTGSGTLYPDWPETEPAVALDLLQSATGLPLTYALKIPGAEMPEMTQEETALAEANGWRWSDAVLISRSQVYGRNMGRGWIYVAPDGSRWRVSGIEQLFDNEPPYEWTFTLERFGEFGADPESHEIVLSLPDIGQTGAPTERWSDLHDVRSDGAQVVMSIGPGPGPEDLLPEGYLLLDLSGQPGDDLDVTATLLADFETALGSGDTGALTPGMYTWPETDQLVSEEHSGAVSDPPCDGQSVRTYERISVTVEEFPNEVATPGNPLERALLPTSHERELYADRIVGYFYDADDVPQPIKVTARIALAASHEIAAQTGGQLVDIQTYTEVQNPSPHCIIDWSWDREASPEGPEGEENTYHTDVTENVQADHVAELQLDFAGTTVTRAMQIRNNGFIAFSTGPGSGEFGQPYDSSITTLLQIDGQTLNTVQGEVPPQEDAERFLARSTTNFLQLPTVGGLRISGAGREVTFRIIRYENRVYGVVAEETTTGLRHHGPILYPAGSDPEIKTFGEFESSDDASYDPIHERFARSETNEPVRFI